MPHASKKPRLVGLPVVGFNDLSTDELALIFGYLSPEDVMRARLSKKMREAAKKTIVPLTRIPFIVDSVKKYNTMAAMTTALPNLQQITLRGLGHGHKYSDGEDPYDMAAARTANYTTQDVDIISRFRKLRELTIWGAPLNGRYPVLFNFPLLQKLRIMGYVGLKWDLEMLAGLPLLKELDCCDSENVSGNINSLRVLKDTLEEVRVQKCYRVQGNVMALADFPHLKKLNLRFTAVTGDIRDIRENDFSALESLCLPSGVYGGAGYEFLRISDAPHVMSTLYSIKKQRPTLLMKDWYGELSVDSPDWYEEYDDDTAPLFIAFVQAGSRVGYRWENEGSRSGYLWRNDSCVPCEVNWLDPEPARESSDYAKYTKELHEIEQEVDIYRGFQQPPTEEEYRRLWEGDED